MLPEAVDLRVHVYDHLLDRGWPPKIGKTVLVHPDTGEMDGRPLRRRGVPVRVTGSRVTWLANCAWDMLGVAVIANERVRIDISVWERAWRRRSDRLTAWRGRHGTHGLLERNTVRRTDSR